LQAFLNKLRAADDLPQSIYCVLPGDYRLKKELDNVLAHFNSEIEWLSDQHFLAEPGEFKQWLAGRKNPIMEHWYRHIRKRLNILMQADGKPEGGEWNYDKYNRKAFTKKGPPQKSITQTFELDDISRQVLAEVEKHLDLPGEEALKYWPVNRDQALLVLQEFIDHKLTVFGDYQDAMWQDEPWLYHSRLGAAMNIKLLHPMEVIQAVEKAYRDGQAPINAVEGFIRQIAGWREYMRGLYWSYREDWLEMNELDAHQNLPKFYWDAETEMNCLQQSLSQVLSYGYGHHIQRLMVTGLFSLLYGVKPNQIHEWYLAMYVDAIAWVEIPNTLGMSQFADGGIVGTKPYIASGAYIDRMSNYCKSCPFNPKQATGENACPFTTLYWDFIERHTELLSSHYRLGMQVRHWQNKSAEEQKAIQQQAQKIRNDLQ
ncbi:MAG: cryptochrome/photolyase family protein, partial [Gammaproteobacteria bacterium]|nr:cryptochrome/photolyase family protein [Gammaproteobacteria bacterium]NNJ72033.1 cryptochrome/photolyase family protein [Enterobacterales bacterium]